MAIRKKNKKNKNKRETAPPDNYKRQFAGNKASSQTELMHRVCQSTCEVDGDSDSHSAQTPRRLALNIPALGD